MPLLSSCPLLVLRSWRHFSWHYSVWQYYCHFVCHAQSRNLPAAPLLHASAFGSALGSSRSSAQVQIRHYLPSCSQSPWPRSGITGLTVTTSSSRSSLSTQCRDTSNNSPLSLAAQPSSEEAWVWTDTPANIIGEYSKAETSKFKWVWFNHYQLLQIENKFFTSFGATMAQLGTKKVLGTGFKFQ